MMVPGRPQRKRWGTLVLLIAAAVSAPAQVYINEVLFNPPGSVDSPNEYVELRGTPNYVLPTGTCFVAVEGNATGNPGSVRNVIDLGGRALGGNGCLVLLQKYSGYTVNSNATVLANTNGLGWGSGSTSSVGHRGAGGQTNLENPSVSFFLVRAANLPSPGDDLDANNDGVPDGLVWAGWTVLDSVGVLDGDNTGDIAYGAINFRRNAVGTAYGTVVPVTFEASYVGRTGNTTGWSAGDWVASTSLAGNVPNWSLGNSGNTAPPVYAGQALNHIGSPNFGAPASNGVVAVQSGWSTVVVEGGTNDTYRLGLNTAPSGNVIIQISAGSQLQISTNNGTNWAATAALTFNSTAQKTVAVRALDDNVVDTSPHWRAIRHAITNTADPTRYPTSALTPVVNVAILENDSLLLSELKVNPPGTNDAPWEFVEIQGPPNAVLTNVYLLVVESAAAKDRGEADLVVNLTSARLGSSGLLVIGATNNPYNLAPTTGYFGDPRFNQLGGALGNGSKSFLLVSSLQPLVEGTDMDGGDNGVLEGLPEGTTIMDSVAWSDGTLGDILYSDAVLTLLQGTPDAATRYPGDVTPNSAEAWFYGNLLDRGGNSLIYDSDNASPDFPVDTWLTPGTANNTAPTINSLPALSGVVGDPTNPQVIFAVDDAETAASLLTVTATSTNPAVVPDANLVVTVGGGGLRTLTIQPVGVGYTLITLTVSDGTMIGQVSFPYAASAPGRPGGHFHTMVSDGSAAFAVDTNLMFIADDENQNIRLYKRNESGGPLAGFDFTDNLNLTELYGNGTPKEMDIEASTRVGNRVYWLGSESNAELGDPHPNRNRVFASDLSGSGTGSRLTYVGRYEHLKEDILNWDANNLHGKGANYYGLVASAAAGVNPKEEDGSGFNLEGLTMAPGSSTVAYIGLRAPYVPPAIRARALILVVTNFDTLAISGAGPGATRFGRPIELNLIRRGIRSMEAISNGVLIVAGPAGKANGVSPNDFKLFTWSGRAGDPPQERAADLAGLNPEGIVEAPRGPWGDGTIVQLISDNGTTVYYGDGVEAKHLPELPFKKFRSDWVTLGSVVVSKPILRSVRRQGGQVVLSWYAVEGLTYRVQWQTYLNSALWTDVPGDVTATDSVAWKTLPDQAGPQCFYRVTVR